MNSKTQTMNSTIPDNTMGYLKFAYYIIESKISLRDLFLEKSIQQIVHIVSDVVNNGNQHNDIICLLPQQEPVVNVAVDPDNIVNELVSLARNTDAQARGTATPIKKTKSKATADEETTNAKAKKTRAKAPIGVPSAAETTAQDEDAANVTPTVVKAKKTRAKAATAVPTEEAVPTAAADAAEATPTVVKAKKTRAKAATAVPTVEAEHETTADATPTVVKAKKTRAKAAPKNELQEVCTNLWPETPNAEVETKVETPKVKKPRAKANAKTSNAETSNAESPNVETKPKRVTKAKDHKVKSNDCTNAIEVTNE